MPATVCLAYGCVTTDPFQLSPTSNLHAICNPPLLSSPSVSLQFLVGRDGRVHGRFLPRTRPAELEPSIRCLLAEGEEQTGGPRAVKRSFDVFPRLVIQTGRSELKPSVRCLLAEGEEQGSGGAACEASRGYTFDCVRVRAGQWELLKCSRRRCTTFLRLSPKLSSPALLSAAAVPRSASGSTVRAPEHGGMVGVLVDGIGREVKEFLLHPKEDELLPSQRKAAAAAAAAPATGGSDQLSAEPAAAGAAAGPPIGASAATLAAAARPAQAAGQAAEQREHLPVLERVMREAPGEASKC